MTKQIVKQMLIIGMWSLPMYIRSKATKKDAKRINKSHNHIMILFDRQAF